MQIPKFQRQKLLPMYHNNYHRLNTKMRIVLYCRDYSLTYYEKVPKTIVTKQRMRRKHDVLFPFDRSGRGDAKH